MKRVIAAAVGTIAGIIMLLSFKTQPTTTVASSPAAIGTAGPGPSTTSGSTSTSTGRAVTTTRTVTGNAADTRYGPVQVQITVSNGQITAVRAIDYPTAKSKDVQINSYAIPRLNQEALAAKSAHIDMISGATYTSRGYISSLQSALNNAGLV